MTALLAKRKCGCERACCSLCGHVEKAWDKRCLRHAGDVFAWIGSVTTTICEKCARSPRHIQAGLVCR